MLLRNARLGFLAIIALVLLRFVIGFHFYMEGTAKVREGGFSSTGFLSAAKGPFAKNFQSLVPDFDGNIRLDSGDKAKNDYKSGALKDAYDGFATESAGLFKFTVEQETESKKIIEESRKLLVETYKTHKDNIEEYKNGMSRIASLENDKMRLPENLLLLLPIILLFQLMFVEIVAFIFCISYFLLFIHFFFIFHLFII